jgi:hypothetical protein
MSNREKSHNPGETLLEPQDSAAETSVSAEEAQSQGAQADPNDFDAQMLANPQKALEEMKKHQAAADRAHSQLKKLELTSQIADAVGGDQALLQREQLLDQMLKDPKMSKAIQSFQSGGSIDASVFEDDQFRDPEAVALEQELQKLRGTVTGLESQVGQTRFESAIRSFNDDSNFQMLNEEERSKFNEHVETQVKQLNGTDAGRQALRNFNAQTMRYMFSQWLADNNLISEIGIRQARQKQDVLRTKETDGPSPVNTNAAQNPVSGTEISAVDAFRAARERVERGL